MNSGALMRRLKRTESRSRWIPMTQLSGTIKDRRSSTLADTTRRSRRSIRQSGLRHPMLRPGIIKGMHLMRRNTMTMRSPLMIWLSPSFRPMQMHGTIRGMCWKRSSVPMKQSPRTIMQLRSDHPILTHGSVSVPFLPPSNSLKKRSKRLTDLYHSIKAMLSSGMHVRTPLPHKSAMMRHLMHTAVR